jgi:hypothetical protein
LRRMPLPKKQAEPAPATVNAGVLGRSR